MTRSSRLLRFIPRLVSAVCVALALAGCAGLRAVNTPIAQHDPAYGYRPQSVSQRRAPGRTILMLAFSGGGTRAAAFAYGVLEELRDTPIPNDADGRFLLEEVDTISGVSGGSFPAAYYGLFGDRIFTDFEERFLKKNIQLQIVFRALRPWNLFRLMTPALSRSDLASRLYDEKIFDGATFASLTQATGPRIDINATDLSSGDRFTFNQQTFDIICSDLGVLPVATAVAASSAVPMLLSPIALQNFAGTCGYEPPAWVVEALASRDQNPRLKRSADGFLNMQNAEAKRYLHLVDGGISDNLGLRRTIDFVTAVGSAQKALEVQQIEAPDQLVLIVVNAETDPNPTIDLQSSAPSFAMLMNSVSGGQIRRYNFETLLLAEEVVDRMALELSAAGHPATSHMINVSFDNLADEEERRYFKRLPTSFFLQDEHVDRLRDAGRRLLRDSPEFQRLLAELK